MHLLNILRGEQKRKMRDEILEKIKTEAEKYKTINVHDERIVQAGYLSIYQANYDLKNGHTINREIIQKDGRDGSATIIVPITKENNVVLVIEPRIAIKGGVGVDVPAGLMEDGEEPKEVALRELREETGYIPEKCTKLVKYYPDEATSKGTNYIFIAEGCEKKTVQDLDSDEYISVIEVSFEEAFELVSLGYIRGGISIMALMAAKQYLADGKPIN